MCDASRRDFLCGSIAGLAGAAALGTAGLTAERAARAGGAFGAVGGVKRMADVARRVLGRTGLEVSVLGFGGAEIGYGQTPQDTVRELLHGALDAGLNTIDTAECYAESEVLIGNTVGDRREEYVLLTKVGHWAPEGVDPWSAEGVMRSIERSLERLRTDHVDIVHLHSCGVDVLERGEAADALDRARQAGKTRFVGYSGDSRAARFAVESGRFDTLMTSISVFDQEAIELTLPLCREKDMGVIVKRGIGNAVWRYDALPDNGYVQEYWRRMRELDYDFCRAERRGDEGPEGPAGVALRFVLALEGVHTNVVGTTNPARFAQNAALLEPGPLAAERVEAIRKRWKEVARAEWVGQI